MAKQYGLIKSEKKQIISRLACFNESSDSDDNSAKPTGTQQLKKKERLAQEKIVAEDPTVYQYDELYDEIQTKRKDSKLARKDLEKKPKYINKLLETADRRKKENERRIERQVQKEREEEGDMFKDKESFVTSAYRKKLEEMKELEEKEKREEYLETIGDVKKQGDLSGFYRHLYAQQINYEEEKEKQKNFEKIKEGKTEEIGSKTPEGSKTPKIEPESPKEDEKSKSPEPTKNPSESPSTSKITKQKRKYRTHKDSASEDSSSEKEIKLEHLPSNLDADSDFSIDSDSDSESESKKPKIEVMKEVEPPQAVVTEIKEEEKDVPKEDVVEKIPEVPKKPRRDIWKKRTVGTVFDEAMKRYYERKAARLIAI